MAVKSTLVDLGVCFLSLILGDAVSKRNHLEKQEMYLALLPELLPSNCTKFIIVICYHFMYRLSHLQQT